MNARDALKKKPCKAYMLACHMCNACSKANLMEFPSSSTVAGDAQKKKPPAGYNDACSKVNPMERMQCTLLS